MSNTPHATRRTRLTPGELRSPDRVSADNRTRDSLVARVVQLAFGPWQRLRGLIGRDPLEADEGLLLRPCRGIHTFMMAWPIDVLFLDPDGRVVALAEQLRPWRMTAIHGHATCALELCAGRIASTKTEIGDRLGFRLFVE